MGPDGRSSSVVFTFLESGNNVTVTGSLDGQSLDILDVKISGSRIFVTARADETAVFSGTISGDGRSVRGSVDEPGAPPSGVSWSAQKE